MKNYYEILGVSPKAPIAEIRRVYRRLALQYHPDKNPAPEAQQMFLEISEAYEVIGNEENRRWYDIKSKSPDIEVEDEPVNTKGKSTHRDPAYKPHTPPPVSAAKERLALITKCLPYVSWATWAGLALMITFVVDYSLPLWNATETVTDCYNIKSRRGGTVSTIIKTTGMHTMRVYEGSCFDFGSPVDLNYTPILRSVFKITARDNPEKFIETRGVYGNIIIVPLLLFLGAIVGFFLRKNVEMSFNVNIVNTVMFFIVVYFILRG